MKTAIFINRSANNGNAQEKWLKIQNYLSETKLSDYRVIEYDVPFDYSSKLQSLIKDENVTCFISGGGDGSVNFILNSLINLSKDFLDQIILGGIGLGSSNDFTKPQVLVNQIPVRLNTRTKEFHDIGKVTFIDEKGEEGVRYFIINSSVGVLAKANYLFNKGDYFIDFFKNRAINLTINYTAIKTFLTFKNSKVLMQIDGKDFNCNLTSLSVLKNSHVSGEFKFNQINYQNDGLFGINYCKDLTHFELLSTMLDLKNEKFITQPMHSKRGSVKGKNIKLISENYLYLETDGEVIKAKEVEFSIITQKIRVLGIGI